MAPSSSAHEPMRMYSASDRLATSGSASSGWSPTPITRAPTSARPRVNSGISPRVAGGEEDDVGHQPHSRRIVETSSCSDSSTASVRSSRTITWPSPSYVPLDAVAGSGQADLDDARRRRLAHLVETVGGDDRATGSLGAEVGGADGVAARRGIERVEHGQAGPRRVQVGVVGVREQRHELGAGRAGGDLGDGVVAGRGGGTTPCA